MRAFIRVGGHAAYDILEKHCYYNRITYITGISSMQFSLSMCMKLSLLVSQNPWKRTTKQEEDEEFISIKRCDSHIV